MTCKDCYHYEACLNFEKRNAFLEQRLCIEPTIICDFFKDKTKIIELPCKVGDAVYVVNPNYQQLRIREYEVQSIEIYKNSLMCIRFGKTVSYFSDDIGKTVFLSLEDAKKRLEELKNV